MDSSFFPTTAAAHDFPRPNSCPASVHSTKKRLQVMVFFSTAFFLFSHEARASTGLASRTLIFLLVSDLFRSKTLERNYVDGRSLLKAKVSTGLAFRTLIFLPILDWFRFETLEQNCGDGVLDRCGHHNIFSQDWFRPDAARWCNHGCRECWAGMRHRGWCLHGYGLEVHPCWYLCTRQHF